MNAVQNTHAAEPILVIPGRCIMDESGQRMLYRRDTVMFNDREIGFIQSTSDRFGAIASTSHCGPMAVYGTQPEWIASMSEMLESYDLQDAESTNCASRELFSCG